MDLGRVKFGRRANKRFNYRPMYYDPDMEDLRHRVKNAEMERTGVYDEKGFKERIRTGYKNKTGQYSSQYNVVASGARVRVLFIALALGVLCYLIFYTRTFSSIFESLYNA